MAVLAGPAALASSGSPAHPIQLAQSAQGAQKEPRLVVTVAPILQAEPASRTRLPIQIAPQDGVAKNSFIRIRGLPPAAALSDGHAIAPGAWAVPLAVLPNLSVILPVGVQGPSDVTVSLISVDGEVLAEAKMVLKVSAPPPPAPPAPPPEPKAAAPPAPPPAAAVPAAPVLLQAERERALSLHAKGMEQLDRGNVYAARKFFERATEIGLAQSAVALAATYDPNELAKLRVVGLQPDVQAARKWYERARELGATEAAERLSRLGTR